MRVRGTLEKRAQIKLSRICLILDIEKAAPINEPVKRYKREPVKRYKR
jgi:hypothetical protein